MQVFTSSTSTEVCESRLDLTKMPDTYWVKFGQEAFLVAGESDWYEIATHSGRLGTPLQRQSQAREAENLHLIVQKGRLFQQEHPDIPVLFDKGRFLAVDLAPKLAESFNKGDEPCYKVLPLRDNRVAFQLRPQIVARRTLVAEIETLVRQVSRSHLEEKLTQLVSWSTRYSTSPNYFEAASWAKEQLDGMGYQTQLIDIAVGDRTSQNVIADRPGCHSETRNLVLVTAHLDSINQQGGSLANAPGADDNGSGSVGLLEIARLLQAYPNRHDLRLILFGGEEQGLFGSKQYVETSIASDRARITAVLNMDMIGTANTPTPTVLLEGASVSQSVIDRLGEAAETYTNLSVQISFNPFASDHVPFIDINLPAVLTIEGADSANANIHSADDTLEHISYDLMLEILKMNVAFLANVLSS